jgi:hypothetical protein
MPLIVTLDCLGTQYGKMSVRIMDKTFFANPYFNSAVLLITWLL